MPPEPARIRGGASSSWRRGGELWNEKAGVGAGGWFDGWMTRTEEKKAQQQEAGVEDPASQ